MITKTISGTEAELRGTVEQFTGALGMLHNPPAAVRESMETNLRTATVNFQLQSSQVQANLTAQIQRTRQNLSNGMIEMVARFMQQAYDDATNSHGGAGIKRRMLDILIRYAETQAPQLFINMRQELAEGVAVLQEAMMPQLSSLIAYGEGVLDRFSQNLEGFQGPSPRSHKDVWKRL